MSKQMIISVMSQDRPGIIADITGAIYELNGDLADLNQSILCGYLTMILIATFDDGVTPEDLTGRVAQIESDTQLNIVVRKMTTPITIAQTGLPQKTYLMTAQGLNRKGLVHGISSFCYQHNINILDLVTTRTDDRYTMILQLDLSQVDSILDVRNALTEYGEQSGLQVLLQHHDLFKVTNEITF
jgi:glycine cleavage system transcriptional repressor